MEKKSFKRIHGSLAHVRPDAVEATLAKLRKDPRIRYAEPNFVVHAEATPNDPSFSNLWGLNNTGQAINGFPGTPDADIDAPEAWNVTTGSADVDGRGDRHRRRLVASGPQPRRSGSTPARTAAAAAPTASTTTTTATSTTGTAGTSSTTTTTRWTTTATARTSPGRSARLGNNGVGVAGVNWNARIMPLKFLNAQGAGSTADAISAVSVRARRTAPT